jgi:hypothetical protein
MHLAGACILIIAEALCDGANSPALLRLLIGCFEVWKFVQQSRMGGSGIIIVLDVNVASVPTTRFCDAHQILPRLALCRLYVMFGIEFAERHQ